VAKLHFGLAVAGLLCAATVLVRVDNATSAFPFRSVPVLVADRTINERLAGTNTFQVLVEGEEGAIKNPEVLRAMAATQRFLEREPQIGKTLSIVDFLTRASEAREVSVPLSDGATIAWLYRHGEVRSRRDDGEMARLTVALDAAASAQFERRLIR